MHRYTKGRYSTDSVPREHVLLEGMHMRVHTCKSGKYDVCSFTLGPKCPRGLKSNEINRKGHNSIRS